MLFVLVEALNNRWKTRIWHGNCCALRTDPDFFSSPPKRSKTAHQGLFVKQNIVEEVIKKKSINAKDASGAVRALRNPISCVSLGSTWPLIILQRTIYTAAAVILYNPFMHSMSCFWQWVIKKKGPNRIKMNLLCKFQFWWMEKEQMSTNSNWFFNLWSRCICRLRGFLV